MGDRTYDVVGIGNAVVDIISRVEDSFLTKHDLQKGFMQLIEEGAIAKLYDDMGPAIERSGGSAANTIAGIASFGAKTGFIGKVGGDEFGDIFRHDVRSLGVAFDTAPLPGDMGTGRCLVLVTPDGERTMSTFLGAGTGFQSSDLDKEMIEAAKIIFLEGYLYDQPEAKKAFHEAAEIAQAAGTKVALTLSDAFCVDRHREDFLKLVKQGADIVFANEKEATALYEVNSVDEAAQNLAADCELAILTRSEEGSMILASGYRVDVPAAWVEEVVDVTGAGDLYAAGFLYGLSTGEPLETCGKLGSLAAAEIISHIGARPEIELKTLLPGVLS
ncbi:adenosine kinase [Methyloligella sp. 2.7D]|uniref:adenosine kinase n=1 Tax=unclassified Methyloligella TaxID=2625955 RepID=UPI00157D515E|nr:adenosine kinase [Methyloligella sp. GL2]QKP76295.1 adenosine kinase [Methyloligella sp. GL2]